MDRRFSFTNLKDKTQSAFTLVELLVVIAIIGILVSVSIVSWLSVAARGRDSQRKSDLARLKQVLIQQYGDTRTYPTFEINNAGPIYAASWQLTGSISGCLHTDTVRLPTKYLEKVPTDPRDGADYQNLSCTDLNRQQANRYLYLTAPTSDSPSSPASGFGLMATLEQNRSDWVADALNPLIVGTTNFGSWYKNFPNYTTFGVTANYLVDSQSH